MNEQDFLYRLAELERKLANLIKVGQIVDADYPKARVKVDLDSRQTGWLPWFTHRAGPNASWDAPERGEQVAVLSPDGNPANGLVLPALYQKKHPAPAQSEDITRTVYGDGLVVEHDRANKITRISALDSEGTLVFQGKNIVNRIGDKGFLHTDLAGYASRTTHEGGASFKTESWHTGAVFDGPPDYGFSPPMVLTEPERAGS